MTQPNSNLPNLNTKVEEFITELENSETQPLYELTPEKAREFLNELQTKNYKNIDYNSDKILIRQTGDRVIAAVDRNKLAVLNNLHVGISKKHNLDLDRLTAYLNSDELNFYYQAVTMESDRPLAQTDLETLRELPMPEDFCS